VTFGAYANRLTKADIADAAALQASSGFGVFAYYTDDNVYDQSYLPNFMYNTAVTYGGGAWTYAPIKYWPNEYGENAVSGDVDKVTFFAYAPYFAANLATGSTGEATGIVGFSRNREAGDPIVKYKVDLDPASYNAGQMDLMWGVVSTTDAAAWAVENVTPQNALVGEYPWLNVERPADAAAQKVKFTFYHALSKLNVSVDSFVDGTVAADPAANTKIFIREISFTGFATEGALNLNNVTAAPVPYWMSFEGDHTQQPSDNPVVIYDGRKNGSEGMATGTNPNEKPAALNGDLIQTNAVTAGVTGTPTNLFKNAALATDEIAVIPTGAPVNVTIVYDVETMDPNLPYLLSDGTTHGSTIENKITKLNVFTNPLEAGKKYILNLHLGMASVKFDAAVEAWTAGANANVDVPAN